MFKDVVAIFKNRGGSWTTLPPRYPLHKLRKTWATRLALAGMPLHVLQRRLGHRTLLTTQHYLAGIDLFSKETNKIVEAAMYLAPAKKV